MSTTQLSGFLLYIDDQLLGHYENLDHAKRAAEAVSKASSPNREIWIETAHSEVVNGIVTPIRKWSYDAEANCWVEAT